MKKLIILHLFLLFAACLYAQDQFINNGDIKINAGAEIGFFGDVINNGSLLTDAGSLVTMAGLNSQMIGGSTVTTFNELEINNSSVAGVSLQQSWYINGVLTLTAGFLNTSSSNILIINNMATISGGSSSSFVSGPIIKTGNQAFTFPIGKSGQYAPITISAPSLISDQFIAEYHYEDAGVSYDAESKDLSLHHISGCEYWTLNRTTGTSNVNVTLGWDTRSCDVNNLSDLRIARWNGTTWKDQGNGGTTGTYDAGTIITAAPVTEFSPFTLSSISEDNTLPIDLLSFKVSCANNTAFLEWETANELNNDYFTIEHSINAKDWKVIGKLNGAGNSTTVKDYSFVFNQSNSDRSYFRLKQTDFDGEFNYFPLVALNSCGNDFEDVGLVAFPNPTNGVFRLSFKEAVDQVHHINVINALGKIIYHTTDYQSPIDLSDQPSGTYFIQATLGTKQIIEKIMVSR